MEPVELYMTDIDLKLFMDHYDLFETEWHDGYVFRSQVGIFTEYIDKWYGLKATTKDKGLRQTAKLRLNSCYGKTGTNPKKQSLFPVINPDKDAVDYVEGPVTIEAPVYTPIAAWITAYCRDKIIRAAQKVKDRFVYADTDSLHILGCEPVPLEISDSVLGAFKVESRPRRAKFLRAKTYMEEIWKDEEELENGEIRAAGWYWETKAAGCPAVVKEKMTPEEFNEGAVFEGKLISKRVKGGTVLWTTTFQIKK